ncbi:Heat shock factor protein 3 [Ancistrocladus abbreviatus]
MEEGSTITTSTAMANLNSPPPFLSKTYDMVDDPATDSIVSWSKNNNSFVVWNVPEFSRDLLPKYFKHNNFSSFVRQLNTYGFRKVDPDHWEFANEGFLRGQKHLLKSINRRKPAHPNTHQPQPPVHSTTAKSCVEVGKFGLDEEVERLKRDKNILMQELVRLRQQQQSTDNQLQSVGQRIQVMEQRQQQMMSFLAKAMQSPGFLAQIVQQQNEGGRHITGISKKRRLPKHDDENTGVMNGATLDGQIVKFQPLINEAAKSMLRQILTLNSSPRLDQSINDPNFFLIDNVPSPSSAVDSRSSSNRTTGVTLSEVLPTSGQPCFPAETGFSIINPSIAASDHSSPRAGSDSAKAVQFPEVSINNSQESALLSNLNEMQGVLPESSTEFPGMTFTGTGSGSPSFLDPLLAAVDQTMPIRTDEFSADDEMDVLLDGVSKLPGSNDAFWEQFFSANTFPDDKEEVDSSTPEGDVVKENELQFGQDEELKKIHHMNHLTEQMGLLTAEAKRL